MKLTPETLLVTAKLQIDLLNEELLEERRRGNTLQQRLDEALWWRREDAETTASLRSEVASLRAQLEAAGVKPRPTKVGSFFDREALGEAVAS